MDIRIKQLQQELKRKGWDAYWVVSPANRRYLTGFSGSAGWVLVPVRGAASLITDGRYVEQARQEAPKAKLIMCQQNIQFCLARWLKKHDCQSLGFEEEQVTVSEWVQMKKLFPKLSLRPGQDVLTRQRQVKSAPELTAIKQAIHIAEQAFVQVSAHLRPGMTEKEVALRLEQAMLSRGAEALAFPTIVAAGPHGALPHAQPRDQKLKKGDLVVIDFGCRVRGYHSDLTRTVAIAKMTPLQNRYYKCVKNAQKTAQKLLVSGAFTADSDRAARAVLKAEGLGRYFVHSLGHGLGQEIHEAPRLSSSSKERLLAGMVVTCEPGIYLPRWGGIRIEDDVLVGTRPVWLSRSPEELMVLGR